MGNALQEPYVGEEQTLTLQDLHNQVMWAIVIVF